MTKNPLHERWIVETFPAQYHLSDFTEYFDLAGKQRTTPMPSSCVTRGRNDKLFHTLRHWGYRQALNHHSEAGLFAALLHQAGVINADFPVPLPFAEIQATARAMAKWVWNNRHGLGRSTRAKVLSFGAETASERMQAGAVYTNQKRREKSIEVLRAAVEELLPIHGHELRATDLAAHTGQNIKTVRKYLPSILSSIAAHD